MTPQLFDFPHKAFGDAFSERQMTHFFQSVVAVDTGQVVGFEALARWQHPQHGLLASGAFIVSLVNQGFASALTRLAIEKIAAFYQQSCANKLTCVPVSVNVTAAELEAPMFVTQFVALLQTLGLPKAFIQIELLEWSPASDMARLTQALNDLAVENIAVKADDFGDAYASFNRMLKMPFSGIKLDGEYVRSMGDKPQAQIIIKTLASFADDMHMSLVVEGVETQAQLDQLSSIGVHQAQGYLFGRPMRSNDAMKLLKEAA